MISPRRCVETVLLVLALVLLSAAGAPAQAGTTHLGVPAGDLILLEGFDPDGPSGPLPFTFGTNLPDGTSGGPFRVPQGMLLVITDVDWLYLNGTPDAVQTLNLHIKNHDTPSRRGSGLMSTVRLDGRGQGGASVNMGGGFAVGPGGDLSVETVFPMPGAFLTRVLVKGYLTPQS